MCPHGMELRNRSMKGAIEELSIDRMIFASNRSCKPYSITQMDQQVRISEHFGVPAVPDALQSAMIAAKTFSSSCSVIPS